MSDTSTNNGAGALAVSTASSLPIVSAGVPATLDEVFRIGNVLAKSGFFADSREVAQACAKVLAGRELGIGPLAAMTGLHVIKGKVTLSANLIAAQIRRSGRYSYRVRQLDKTECHLEFFEGGQSIGESRLTMAEAVERGLDMDVKDGRTQQKGPWRQFPENMLFARAMSNGARWYCPDVFSGPVYTPEEMGANVDVDGAVIELTPVTSSSTAATEAVEEIDPDTGEIMAAPAEPLATEEQISTIRRLAEQTGYEEAAICEGMHVETLAELPGNRAARLVRRLQGYAEAAAADAERVHAEVAKQIKRLHLTKEVGDAVHALLVPGHEAGTPMTAEQARKVLEQLRKFKNADAAATWVDLEGDERQHSSDAEPEGAVKIVHVDALEHPKWADPGNDNREATPDDGLFPGSETEF